MNDGPRHFLDLTEIDEAALRQILKQAAGYKTAGHTRDGPRPLTGRTLAMIFEKPSTRTRVSFEVAMKQLGGNTVVLSMNEMQIGRGETLADTARVLSRYVDGIMIRANSDTTVRELTTHAGVPVINGLTDRSHPCQLMADIMTFEEHRGCIRGKHIAWCGDGNNMARTWIDAAARFRFEIHLACPPELAPPGDIVDRARNEGAKVHLTRDPGKAVTGADCVVTDTWVSMGDRQAEKRRQLLAPYRVDEALMSLAGTDAVFMHCLPAHRGEEVVDSIMDGPHSLVWDEAENRLHVQKAILAWCLT